MKREKTILLPERRSVPSSLIYTQYFTTKPKARKRDVLLCIPGGPGNDHAIYNSPTHSMVEAFLPFTDILLFDPRSCGKSEKIDPSYSHLDHYIDDIEAIRQQFDIESERLIILGQSYGSIAALGYAIKYPNSLHKLILIGGGASFEFLEEAKKNLKRIGSPQQQKVAEKLWMGTFTGDPKENDEFFQTMTPLYQNTFQPGMPTPPLTYNVDVLNFGFGNFLKQFDFRSTLSNVTCKTLILWGSDDWISDPNQGKIIHHGIATSSLKIYPHCSHLLWLDNWKEFSADVIEFLKNIPK